MAGIVKRGGPLAFYDPLSRSICSALAVSRDDLVRHPQHGLAGSERAA